MTLDELEQAGIPPAEPADAEPEPEPEPEPQAIASIDAILATADLEAQYVRLPAPYEGGIRVRPLTMDEMNQARRASTHRVRGQDGAWVDETNADEVNKSVVLMALVEPGLTPPQYDALMKKNYGLMTTILAAVNKINGVSLEALQEVLAQTSQQF